MSDKTQLAAWAFSIIREHADRGSYGTITISMANGIIGNVKEEINRKPILDGPKKQ